MTKKSRPPAYFEQLYAENPDPWNFVNSPYEQEKYQSTLAALDGRRFKNAFEAGCSIGVLTKQLAAHCDRLLAVDIVDSALAAAAARCRGLHHVTFNKLRIPTEWPMAETFDLILLSEILYFLSAADIAATASHVRHCLAPNGIVVLVNYTATINEPCSGEDAAKHFIQACHLEVVTSSTHETYRVDVLRDSSGQMALAQAST